MKHLSFIFILLTVGGCAADTRPPRSLSRLAPKGPDDSVVAFLLPTKTPTADDMAEAYPARAQRSGLSGTAMVNCVIAPQGALDDCRVVSEDPPGWGFGEASLKVAKLFRWPTVNRDGQITIGHRKMIRIKLSVSN